MDPGNGLTVTTKTETEMFSPKTVIFTDYATYNDSLTSFVTMCFKKYVKNIITEYLNFLDKLTT